MEGRSARSVWLKVNKGLLPGVSNIVTQLSGSTGSLPMNRLVAKVNPNAVVATNISFISVDGAFMISEHYL